MIKTVKKKSKINLIDIRIINRNSDIFRNESEEDF
jgi:hypothetical protein